MFSSPFLVWRAIRLFQLLTYPVHCRKLLQLSGWGIEPHGRLIHRISLQALWF